MSRRVLFIIAIAGIAVAAGATFLQTAPGYMDADYYFAGATQLARGEGFVEPYLWNYLDDPQTLPHPSHAYWMPLTSIIAGAFMKFIGSFKFEHIHWAFILLVGILPPITASMAYHLTDDRRTAYFAGVLSIFPVFYLPFLSTTDTFTIYMILGGGVILIWLRMRSEQRKSMYLFLAIITGVITGLMHLARADGLTWLFLAIVFILLNEFKRPSSMRSPGGAFLNASFVLFGYAIVMGPWLIRNLAQFGAIFPPGGLKTLWLSNYDELFTFPASEINATSWLSAGFATIMKSRILAIGQGIQTAIAVQGEILLAPLILVGVRQLWDELVVKVAVLGWGITFIAMTLFFPFPGARGGFFHSGSALQPLLWVMAAVGFERFIFWGSRVRGWNARQARIVFFAGLTVMIVILSAIIIAQKVIGENINSPIWNLPAEDYRIINQALISLDIADNEVVIVNNPPGFYLASGRFAIPIPDGDSETLFNVAQRFDARYLLLDSNHPIDLSSLFISPDSVDGLIHLATVRDTHIFEIKVSVP